MWATPVLIGFLIRWWWNISDIYRPLLAPTLQLQLWLIASELTFKETLKVLCIKIHIIAPYLFLFLFYDD